MTEKRPDEELWDPAHREPLGVGTILSVDTTQPVDAAQLARWIREAVGA